MTVVLVILCSLLATPASAQIAWSGPRLTPAEAAAVLARMDSTTNRTHVFVCMDCDGPRYAVAPNWPLFQPFPPPRRLDGTLLSQPPWRSTAYVGRSFGTPRRREHDRSDLRAQEHRPVQRR